MPAKFDRRIILLLPATFVVALVIGFGTNILSPDVDDLLLGRFGDGYKKWLWAAVIVCSFISVAWPFLSKSTAPKIDGKPVTMPYSIENARVLAESRHFLEQGEIERSLSFLKKIDNPAAAETVSKLQARYSHFQKDSLAGILSFERKTETQNQLSDGIFKLIAALEKVEPSKSFSPFSKKEERVGEIPEADWLKFRGDLFARYQKRYNSKIEDRIALSMDLSYSKTGFSEPYVERFFIDEAKTADQTSQKLFETFEKYRSIVLTGGPGAGKTTLLLGLALEVMSRSEADPKSPVPIVFNLASWNEKTPVFRDWLVRMLHESYGISRPTAERMLIERCILPFLDGLDELGRSQYEAEQNRLIAACAASIRSFLPEYGLDKMVICSRLAVLENKAVDLPMKASLGVNPLRPEQVREALRTALFARPSVATEDAATNLLHLFDRSPALQKALLTPFYFKIAEQVFDERTAKIELPAGEKAVNEWLTQAFIDKKMRLLKGYEEGNARRWLGWLAARMNEREKVNFELADLEPKMSQSRWMPPLGFSLPFAFLGFLIYRLHSYGIGWYACLSLLLILGLNTSRVVTEDIRKWSFSRLTKLKTWRQIYSSCVLMGSVFGLLVGLYNGLFDGGFANGWVDGMVAGLVLGFIAGFIGQLSHVENYSTLKTPYQRLSAGMLFHTFRWTVIVTALYFAHFISRGKLIDWCFLLLVVLLAIAISLLLTPLHQHTILRLCLFFEKSLPLRLVPFLDYTEKSLRFIDKDDSGTWRFRHQILQDFFAEKWKSGEWHQAKK